MDNNNIGRNLLGIKNNSSIEYGEGNVEYVVTGSSSSLIGDEGKFKQSPSKTVRSKRCREDQLFINKESLISQRKSVICSVKDLVDVPEARNLNDADQSSCGSSFILDEDSSTDQDSSLQVSERVDYKPTVNPSDLECIVTDTDESYDKEENNFERGKSTTIDKPCIQQYVCCLCRYAVPNGEGPLELLKHLHNSHKFAVRGGGLDNPISESAGFTTCIHSARPPKLNEGYLCCKSREGSGFMLNSKEGLSSQCTQSNSATSSCKLAAVTEDKPVTSCSLCSFVCSIRRVMIQHVKTCHDSSKDMDKEITALALDCRVCEGEFQTVSERSKHEVSVHSTQVSHLLLKCYVCSDSFSSKVCLTKHMKESHPDKDQFLGIVGFRCRLCCVTLPSFNISEEHFRKCHSSNLVYRCKKCSSLLKSEKTYKAHLKSTQCGLVHQECSVCKKVLRSKRALSIHYRRKHLSSNHVAFLCRVCKLPFTSKSERKQHYTSEHEGDTLYNCPVCNKGFASKSGMYGHRQTHMKTDISKCEFCGKEFNRRDSYNEHLLIHTGPRHKCPHCEKEFVQRSNLVRHIRIHTGEKPYKCSHCEKTFSDKGACNSHIRVHTREEACGCPYCGQVFSKKQKLKYHIRKHTGDGLVSCEFCTKTFTNSHSLKEHRMIHDHRTQILCVQCGKAFSTSKYLQRHIAMVHEAILIYNCPLCSRAFSQQARLKTHLMTHSRIKHLRCLLCTKAYASRKSLRHHLQNIHSVTIENHEYKQCFYAMTPEEAGLTIPGEKSPRKPKLETISTDSNSEDKKSSSEEDEISDGPPQLDRQEPLNSSVLHHTPFPSVRTKAARKQLPFNISVITEKDCDKIPKRCGNSLIHEGLKTNKERKGKLSCKRSKDGSQAQKHVSAKESISKNLNFCSLPDSSLESFTGQSIRLSSDPTGLFPLGNKKINADDLTKIFNKKQNKKRQQPNNSKEPK